ncbi:MAG: hypothetical protein QXL15_04885, partial [Candidatus Korarchaeota archaeon]
MNLFFRELTPLNEAIKKVSDHIRETEKEFVFVHDAIGRFAGEDIIAPRDVPPYNRSMVDGFAVDFLKTEKIRRGIKLGLKIGTEAIPISTGAPLPEGTNAVYKAEDVSIENEIVFISSPIAKLKNVGIAGEDVRKGEVILKKGDIVTPFHAAQMILAGITRISVFKKPVVRIFATG